MTSRHYLSNGKIKTPRGRVMTQRQYMALHEAQVRRSRWGDTAACEYGHFDCACWERGPCTNEIGGSLDLEGDDEWGQN